jgi:hypothetical protein
MMFVIFKRALSDGAVLNLGFSAFEYEGGIKNEGGNEKETSAVTVNQTIDQTVTICVLRHAPLSKSRAVAVDLIASQHEPHYKCRKES